jgi:hypothetical protein
VATAGKATTLSGLLATIDTLDHQIARVQAETAALLARTQGAKLTSSAGWAWSPRPGLCLHRADRPVGGLVKVWRAAGLDPARSQPGPNHARLGISREGSAWADG